MEDWPRAERQLISRAPHETEALGAALGGLLRAGDVICLSGGLGAGKTLLCRGVGAGWGASIPLTSPTYNLVHEHQRADGGRLYHLDFYRISSPLEAESLGLDDILESEAVCLFEWSERVREILPAARLWIDFTLCAAEARRLRFEARGQRYIRLLDELWREKGKGEHVAGD